MPLIQGACIERKGKFYVVNLIMARGGKKYNQVYGTYIREQEAFARCRRINKAGTCGICSRRKDCKFGK